jgi:hypothetical protein
MPIQLQHQPHDCLKGLKRPAARQSAPDLFQIHLSEFQIRLPATLFHPTEFEKRPPFFEFIKLYVSFASPNFKYDWLKDKYD